MGKKMLKLGHVTTAEKSLIHNTKIKSSRIMSQFSNKSDWEKVYEEKYVHIFTNNYSRMSRQCSCKYWVSWKYLKEWWKYI